MRGLRLLISTDIDINNSATQAIAPT